jgi:hypothetical protein
MNDLTHGSWRRPLVALLLLGMAHGCGSFSRTRAAPVPAAATEASAACDPEKDRQAILAMAGGYDVKFEFMETVALAEGYALQSPYRVGATELVIVAEDTPGKVVLQHILAMGKGKDRRSLKHWRQDWIFEARDVLEYRGGETWARRPLAESQRRCAWTQQVFGIEDGPRYGSWGRWVHQGGVATWTSQDTWRPLPRREEDRDDYDVIVGINRHTITPTGWMHEQDNGKLVLRGRNQLLARERGVIPYTRAPAEDFSAIVKSWRETEAFWRDVRAAWDQVIRSRERLSFLPSAKRPRSLNSDLNDLREKALASSGGTGGLKNRAIETIERHLASASPVAQHAP